MTYWSIEHNEKAWWRSDLKVKANAYKTSSTGGTCTHNGQMDDTAAYTGCTAHSVGVI